MNLSKTEIKGDYLNLERAVEILKRGDVLGIPTETVYGLAAKISDDNALRKIFHTKGRPFFDPLIVHVASIEQAKMQVKEWPEGAQRLAEKFWPGPLTLVLNKQNHISELITSGLETVALRCPKHTLALKIIQELGEPLAAPSANKFGKTSPSTAQHVIEEFAGMVSVVDGGACQVGIESTIVKLTETSNRIELTLLRGGAISLEEIQSTLKCLNKEIVIYRPGTNIEAPGQIKHHYMPSIPLLFIERPLWDSLGENLLQKIQKINNKLNSQFENPCFLDLNSDPAQAARELYSKLRTCSLPPHDSIVFIKESVYQGEFWLAILDRLERASSFKLLN